MAAKSRFTTLSVICMVAGLLMQVIGFVWPHAFPASLYWTDKNEEQLELVSQFVHGRVHRVRQAELDGQPLDEEFLAEYKQATRHGEQMRHASEMARTRPARIAARWRWAGAIVLGLGIVLWYRPT